MHHVHMENMPKFLHVLEISPERQIFVVFILNSYDYRSPEWTRSKILARDLVRFHGILVNCNKRKLEI